MRVMVYQLIVVPLAYLFWLLKLLYLVLGQATWWVVVVTITALILMISLIPEVKPARKLPLAGRPQRGKVEALSFELDRAGKGIYFKWQIANRLGKLAHQILLLRAHGKPRSVFEPLTGDGWNPTLEVQRYLEKGLQGSFADYPYRRWGVFTKPQSTPLDHDVREVVAFLESQQGDMRH
jgi:hypothetical protein